MKTLLILIAFTATTQAQLSNLGGNGPDGVCYYNGTSWQCYPQSQSVPEPSNPFILSAIAGLALIMRRNRKM
ncbi:MAG: hypothetical protein RL621_58 [Bacteroidota bacterium]|jgi:hypothetical protein